jgi:hypothetical protein
MSIKCKCRLPDSKEMADEAKKINRKRNIEFNILTSED